MCDCNKRPLFTVEVERVGWGHYRLALRKERGLEQYRHVRGTQKRADRVARDWLVKVRANYALKHTII